jgi:hypothetical protein
MVVELVSAIDRFVLRTTSFVHGQAVIIVVEVLAMSVQVTPRAGRALHPFPSPRRPS